MIIVKIVYDSNMDTKFQEELVNSLPENVSVETHDMAYTKSRKTGFKVKGAFSARLNPFVGIFKDKSVLKGFYSEDTKTFTIDNIINYLKNLNNESTNSQQIEQ
jgi:hypothetical protein